MTGSVNAPDTFELIIELDGLKQTVRLSAGAAMKSLFAFFRHRAFSRQSEGRASIRSYQRARVR
jgi:hypothetical protein